MPIENPTSIDPALFRQVLGHFPTGVTVIASMSDGEPVGLTIGSFFSISLDPALVGFCVASSSTSWPAIESSGVCGISILADDQLRVCRALSTSDPQKFSGLAWSPGGATGAPLIDDALAHIECHLEARHRGGDHWIVVAGVRDVLVHRAGAPLSFWRGGFGRHQPLDG